MYHFRVVDHVDESRGGSVDLEEVVETELASANHGGLVFAVAVFDEVYQELVVDLLPPLEIYGVGGFEDQVEVFVIFGRDEEDGSPGQEVEAVFQDTADAFLFFQFFLHQVGLVYEEDQAFVGFEDI